MNLQKKLNEWHQNRVIDDATLQAIEHYEHNLPRLSDYLWRYGLTGLAVLCVGLGLAFIVAANWTDIPFSLKLGTHTLLNIGLAAIIIQLYRKNEPSIWKRETPLVLLAGAQLSLMALIGQYLHSSAPTKDVMMFWWMLTAPMLALLGQTAFSALLFLGVGLYVAAAKIDIPFDQAYMGYAVAFTALFVMGNTALIADKRPGWAALFCKIGFAAVLLINLVLLVVPLKTMNSEAVVYATNTFIGLLAAGFFAAKNSGHCRPFGDLSSRLNNQILCWTFLFLALTPYLDAGLTLSALVFCLYFLGLGWLGYKFRHNQWVVTAIVMIAIRLIIYFSMVTNNMLLNGVCMIVVGVTALLLLRHLLKTPTQEIAHD